MIHAQIDAGELAQFPWSQMASGVEKSFKDPWAALPVQAPKQIHSISKKRERKVSKHWRAQVTAFSRP